MIAKGYWSAEKILIKHGSIERLLATEYVFVTSRMFVWLTYEYKDLSADEGSSCRTSLL